MPYGRPNPLVDAIRRTGYGLAGAMTSNIGRNDELNRMAFANDMEQRRLGLYQDQFNYQKSRDQINDRRLDVNAANKMLGLSMAPADPPRNPTEALTRIATSNPEMMAGNPTVKALMALLAHTGGNGGDFSFDDMRASWYGKNPQAFDAYMSGQAFGRESDATGRLLAQDFRTAETNRLAGELMNQMLGYDPGKYGPLADQKRLPTNDPVALREMMTTEFGKKPWLGEKSFMIDDPQAAATLDSLTQIFNMPLDAIMTARGAGKSVYAGDSNENWGRANIKDWNQLTAEQKAVILEARKNERSGGLGIR